MFDDDDSQDRLNRNAQVLGLAVANDLLIQEALTGTYKAPAVTFTTGWRKAPESVTLDRDGDGTPDQTFKVSADNRGMWQTLEADLDHDGNVDLRTQVRPDAWGRNGTAKTTDLRPDGKLSSTATVQTDNWGREPMIFIDRDNDGKADATITVVHGYPAKPEMIQIDRDNDGVIDQVIDLQVDRHSGQATGKPRLT